MAVIYYFKSHRIQAGKAVVSLVLRNQIPLGTPGNQFVEWIGDAYEMREELNEAIAELEAKKARNTKITEVSEWVAQIT